MGCQRLTILTAFALFAKDVLAQYASVVECLPPTLSARPILQAGGQFVLPAVIQPLAPGYDSYGPDFSTYPGYGNFPPPYPLPPIIIEDNNDIWTQLLYFMIFALNNKKGNVSTPPPYNGGCSCGCCSSGNCGSSCNCSNCKNNESSGPPTYIPIPIAIPVFTSADGIPYIDSFQGFCDDIVIQGPTVQAPERDTINLYIRAE